MERKKLCASLIAVAMGFAFSVGGAAAYEQGDFADAITGIEGKLIPYYMAGENMATIIGIDNQASLPATASHYILEVRAFDKGGADQGAAQICLAANQFGYAVLRQETMDDGGTRVGLMTGVGDKTVTIYGKTAETTTGAPNRAGSTEKTTSEGSGISAEGFVLVRHLGSFTNADAVDDVDTNDGCDSRGTPAAPAAAGEVKFATWAILQDVGMDSAFGTEVLSATVAVVAPATFDPDAAAGMACSTTANCPGLMVADGRDATVRFDMSMSNNSQSMIYVWLDSAEAYDATGARNKREVDVTVYCEGATQAGTMKINMPDYVNVIDAMDLECDARGVAKIDLDQASTSTAAANVAAAWSHISQEDGAYRMNMPGYDAAQ